MQVRQLLDAINRARLNVWKRQPPEFFDEAFVDMDGTLTVTTGDPATIILSTNAGIRFGVAFYDHKNSAAETPNRVPTLWLDEH